MKAELAHFDSLSSPENPGMWQILSRSILKHILTRNICFSGQDFREGPTGGAQVHCVDEHCRDQPHRRWHHIRHRLRLRQDEGVQPKDGHGRPHSKFPNPTCLNLRMLVFIRAADAVTTFSLPLCPEV